MLPLVNTVSVLMSRIILVKHCKLVYGLLGFYVYKKCILTLIQEPNQCITLILISSHLLTNLQKEFSCMVNIGILEHYRDSEWISCMLIIPKKDDSVFQIKSLQCLNIKISCKHEYCLHSRSQINLQYLYPLLACTNICSLIQNY